MITKEYWWELFSFKLGLRYPSKAINAQCEIYQERYVENDNELGGFKSRVG